MKIFWTLILVLAIAGAGMLWLRGSGAAGGRGAAGASSPQAAPTARETTPPSPPAAIKATEAPKQAPESTATSGTPTKENTAPQASAPTKPETPIAPPAAQPATKPVDQPQPVVPAPATTAKQEPPTATPAAPSQPTPTPAGPTAPAPPANPAPTGTGQHTGVPPPPTDYKPSDRPAKPHSAVVQADGSTLIDERFKVTGDGTKEKPYVIPWDLLVSASEEYSPRDGRTELPQRVKLLDGKHVELTGNIAFPLLVEEPRELLSMLNQWDGCCIGVPPTPYDAVEVKLTKVVKGPDRLASYGIVRGKLKVEPQLVGKWLVALYAMSDAELIPKGYGGFTP